jgi:membrane-bound serine protease (ClpP class)
MGHYRRANTWLPMVVLLALIALLAALPVTAQAQAETPEIYVLEATGAVGPAFASYIARGIEKADERNVEAVLLVLDTPGGNLDATQKITETIRTSDVPVIIFVGQGDRAASAGLLITLAGHAAAMAPGTAIGATSPVGPQGEDLPTTMQRKAEEYVRAQVRSLAEPRGERAVEMANDAVTEARAYTASEALEGNLVDFVANDVDDLLAQLDGFEVEVSGRTRTLHTRGATLTDIPMNSLERILTIITDPNIIFILMTIGTLAIIVEIRSPGGWVAGAVGVICVGLALYSLGFLPVNWLGIIFVVLAFVLFVLEIKAPTHGVLTATGVASMAVGAIILFSQPGIEPFGELSIPLVVGQSILVGGLFFFLMVMALRAQTRQPTTGSEGLIGRTALVTQELDPQGMVLVLGERWKAETISGAPIPADGEVEIVEVQGFRLRVRPRQTDEGKEKPAAE